MAFPKVFSLLLMFGDLIILEKVILLPLCTLFPREILAS